MKNSPAESSIHTFLRTRKACLRVASELPESVYRRFATRRSHVSTTERAKCGVLRNRGQRIGARVMIITRRCAVGNFCARFPEPRNVNRFIASESYLAWARANRDWWRDSETYRATGLKSRGQRNFAWHTRFRVYEVGWTLPLPPSFAVRLWSETQK